MVMTTANPVLNDLKISGNLPSMPQVLVQLIDSSYNPDVDIQTIATIIDKDAAISAKLLQLVNSAFIGARRTFTNLEQAVIHLGSDTIRNLAISLSVQQVFRKTESSGLLSIDRFWHHSFLSALLARNLARAIGYPDLSAAYLAGLLHDIGKLLLWMAFPGKYAPLLLKGVRCHSGRLAFLEEEKLHVNHCSAGAWLCEQWSLPILLADAIRYHHHPLEEVEQSLPLTRIAWLTDLLSHSETTGEDCQEAAQRLFGLSPAQVHALYAGVEEQIEELAKQLGIHIPRTTKNTQDQDPESQESHKETSLTLINRIREITQLNGLLDALLRAESVDQVVCAVEQGMKILFNQEACLVLVPNGQSETYQALVSNDNPLAQKIDTLTFAPQQYPSSLLGRAIRQQRLVHSFAHKGSDQRPPNLFDAQLMRLLATEGLVVVPMLHRQELCGLLLIGMDEKSLQDFSSQWTPLRLLANHAGIWLSMERLRAEQAERLAAERSQSAAATAKKIAHELNNPLGILRNYLHILGIKNQQGEPIHDELAILDQELERLAKITLELEDLSRQEHPLQLEKLDLHQLITDTLRLFQSAAKTPDGVACTYIPWPQPIILTADRRYLSQILHNLLGNAFDAVANQGTVTVRSLAEEDGTTLITIEDSGPGIAPEVAATMFTAGTSTKGGRHSGLGLPIAHALVGQLGGSMTCRSEPGCTVFTLTLAPWRP